MDTCTPADIDAVRRTAQAQARYALWLASRLLDPSYDDKRDLDIRTEAAALLRRLFE